MWRLCARLARTPRVRPFHALRPALLDDPYKTLGVGQLALALEIKKAYYKLAKQFHPDVNKDEGAETRFHNIQEAYEVLLDSDKKAQYDQFGAAAFDQNGGGGGGFGGGGFGAGGFHSGNPFGQGAGSPFGNINFEDIFGSAFGGGAGGARGRPQPRTYVGDNVEIMKTILFRDAVFGTKIQVNYSALEECGTCHGSGLKKGKNKSTCKQCGGLGQTVHYMQGGFQMASTCGGCGGSGVQIASSDACGTCRGHGATQLQQNNTIDLPPGLTDGAKLRVPGAGDAPEIARDAEIRTTRGDLIVRVRVTPDKRFSVLGNDIVHTLEVPMTTAALGGLIAVPTVDGDANIHIKIPSGTQPGRVISVPQRGMPIGRSLLNRGDMKVVVNVRTLRPETATQTALLEALADTFDDALARRSGEWEASGEKNPDCDHPSRLKRIETFLANTFKKLGGK